MPFDGFPGGLDLPLGALPSARWHGLADWPEARWLRPTPDLPARLLREADRRPAALGAAADPYAPIERRLALTRQVLEALERAGRRVILVTRSPAVLRDRDILARLARRGLVLVCLGLATLDAALARRLEPLAPAPALRLAAIRALAASGIPAGLLVAPLIAGVNDLELECIVAAGAAAGATQAGCMPLDLPPAARPAIEAWVQAQLPHRATQALALVRARGVDAPAGPLADRFQVATARLGLNRQPAPPHLVEVPQGQPEPALAAA